MLQQIIFAVICWIDRITEVLLVLIICVTVLFGIYMYFCSENETKMFVDPRYEERIKKLENKLKN